MNIDNNYPWHYRLTSDELLFVLEGELEVEFSCGEIYHLEQGLLIVIPSGVLHRSFSKGKSVNLSFKKQIPIFILLLIANTSLII